MRFEVALEDVEAVEFVVKFKGVDAPAAAAAALAATSVALEVSAAMSGKVKLALEAGKATVLVSAVLLSAWRLPMRGCAGDTSRAASAYAREVSVGVDDFRKHVKGFPGEGSSIQTTPTQGCGPVQASHCEMQSLREVATWLPSMSLPR